MATRTKAKRKAKAKRKKTSATKTGTRRKTATIRKTKTIGKKAGKKPRLQRKKGKPTAKATVKPRPVSPPAKAKAVRSAQSMAAQPALPEERIGLVTHYYGHLSVATMRLETGTLRVGDVIHIRGHTTDFKQKVESLEINHAPTTEVGPNDDFGLKVVEHAREHDVVYKVRS
jgi:hypothetical protein